MTTDTLSLIDKCMDELVHDKNEYGFNTLREKVEEILKSGNLFLIEGEVDSKAIDMYLKNVITQRNNIKKEQEKARISSTKQKDRYQLIEAICQKLEFETQEEVIKKLEELEKKSLNQLQALFNSL